MNCKICKQEKVKKPDVRGKTIRYLDDKDRLWNGLTCPDCYKMYNRERMRKKRNPPKD